MWCKFGHVTLNNLNERTPRTPEREFFIDNLLVQIHFIIVMIRWTGLAPWEFEFPTVWQMVSDEEDDPGRHAWHQVFFRERVLY